MPIPSIIAIDGPAASGKSTIGEQLALKLKYLYFDTGVIYRTVALAALRQGLRLEDEVAISSLAERIQIDVRAPTVKDGRSSDVLLDGVDVTWDIRAPQVDATVSIVAAYPGVRTALFDKQRQIGLRGEVVMVGRDIGTVVLPEADLKVYLDASVEERARRRYLESIQRGEEVHFAEVLESMRRRDEIDSSRDVAPLKPAENAIILNSDDLSIDQVVTEIIRLWQEPAPGQPDGQL